jgi:hypothetical protein
MFLLYEIKESYREYIKRGVGVMKDKKLKLEELKVSHTN